MAQVPLGLQGGAGGLERVGGDAASSASSSASVIAIGAACALPVAWSRWTVRQVGGVARNSSSWPSCAGMPSVDPDAMAASRASFEG